MTALLPRLADGGTVVCLASGPSLTTEDVNYVRGKAVVIAINDAISLAPWADVVYSSDQIWWSRHYRQLRTFHGIRVRVHASNCRSTRGKVRPGRCEGCQRAKPASGTCWCDGIVTFHNAGDTGISFEPDMICTTQNSGGAAINVAVHLGAKRVGLLGYDMGPDRLGRRHFYDDRAQTITSPFVKFRKFIATMVEPLKAAGVEVVNCSRQTALECFPCRPIEEWLC